MQLNPSEISDLIKSKIENFATAAEARNQGTVVSVTDGIVRIHGLSDAMQGEMLEFPGNTFGLALNLERDSVGAVVLGEYEHITEGDIVKCTGKILEVPVGEALIGRVVNSLGIPIDGKGPINAIATSPIEKVAPGVISRQSVSQPLQTGLKIGGRHGADWPRPARVDHRRPPDRQDRRRGGCHHQPEGHRRDLHLRRGRPEGLLCCQRRAQTGRARCHGHTIVVAAMASDPAAMQYIAPYAGCTMGEYFRDRGEDALIVYDDLTKQAWAYRQISLLLRRPPGREAYPGDVFYLHSRLLERAARVNADHIEKITNGAVKGKTGSLTALPVIETQAGDVSAFVPTNVISITDGQIFLGKRSVQRRYPSRHQRRSVGVPRRRRRADQGDQEARWRYPPGSGPIIASWLLLPSSPPTWTKRPASSWNAASW